MINNIRTTLNDNISGLTLGLLSLLLTIRLFQYGQYYDKMALKKYMTAKQKNGCLLMVINFSLKTAIFVRKNLIIGCFFLYFYSLTSGKILFMAPHCSFKIMKSMVLIRPEGGGGSQPKSVLICTGRGLLENIHTI